nr:unnamed protein product [Callosobruchus analis]
MVIAVPTKRFWNHPLYKKAVMKIECRKHLLRNFCNKLRDICRTATEGNTDTLRKKVEAKIFKLRTSVKKALQYRKNESGTVQSKSYNLKRDIIKILLVMCSDSIRSAQH